jgi:hypothetical protein
MSLVGGRHEMVAFVRSERNALIESSRRRKLNTTSYVYALWESVQPLLDSRGSVWPYRAATVMERFVESCAVTYGVVYKSTWPH